MIDIQTGDVVVCVDDSPDKVTGWRTLKKGRAYRVAAIWAYPRQSGAHVRLEGEPQFQVAGLPAGWSSDRFRKIKPATKKFTTQIKAIRPIREDA